MFKQYPKGEGVSKRIVSSVVCAGLDKATQWLCFEKIHGANGCMIITDNEIKFARRRAIVDDDDNFYNYKKIVERYKDNLRKFYNNIVNIYQKVTTVRVYGELYGGIYPGQQSVDIPVQQGIYYSPRVEFMAFDVHIEMSNETCEWLTYTMYSSELDKVNIPYVTSLFEGSFEDAIMFDNHFETTIPKLHGLPAIEGNICEGIVIKPSKSILLGGDKIMIKSKNCKFTEKKPNTSNVFESITIPEELKDLPEYVNDNRLDAAISKVGEVIPKNMSKIIKEFTSDILEEYMRDHQLSKETKKLTGKMLSKLCVPLVKQRIYSQFQADTLEQ
jgi:Rnl2 family RNA ligase